MSFETMVLEGTKMKCPKCGDTKNLYRPEMMPILTPIQVLDDGSWDWADELHSTWPDYETVKDPDFETEWYCRSCMTHFDAPDVLNVGQEPEENDDSRVSTGD